MSESGKVEGPTRQCLACRSRAAKSRLLRLAVVDGTVAVDPLARRPGRGAYLCPRPSCVAAALRRDAAAIRRALRVAGGSVVDDAGIRVAAVAREEDGADSTNAGPASEHDAADAAVTRSV